MRHDLPLEVHSLLSPILCWVENTGQVGLPAFWRRETNPRHSQQTAHRRERDWLSGVLPTYSLDNLDEVIRVTRHRSDPAAVLWSTPPDAIGPPLNPPPDFSLLTAMRRLTEHYFQWIGPELCIREDMLVGLHELGVRFPLQHLIRFAHTQATVGGHLTQERALSLSDRVGTLRTTYSGLQNEIERGIVEGHLHLHSILSGTESWAALVLGGVVPTRYSGHTEPGGARLAQLGRSVARLMGIALLHTLSRRVPTQEVFAGCFGILHRLDQLYWTRSTLRERRLLRNIERTLDEVSSRLLSADLLRRSGPMKHEAGWLLPLVISRQCHLLRSTELPRTAGGIRAQTRALSRLHFQVQSWLLRNEVHRHRTDTHHDTALLWSLLHQSLFRYVIYNTHHWQQSVHHGRIAGLRYFQSFYRSSFRRSVSDQLEAQSHAFELMVDNQPIRSIEGRLAPPVRRAEYMPWILSFIESWRRGELDRFGIVVHFLKTSPQPRQQRSGTAVHHHSRLRLGPLRQKIHRQALRFYRKLSSPDPIVAFIVGFDAASLELNTPPEVFAPAFRFIREFPIEVRHQQTAAQRFGSHRALFDALHQRRLGMTYHVGEEFRHLLSGLRAIHEAILFLKPQPGDRIGHGTALALEPMRWAQQCGFQAVLSRQEWLDTLIWLHHFLGAGDDLIGALGLEDRVQKLVRTVYQREASVPMATLHDAWRLRQLDPRCVDLTALSKGKLALRSVLGHGQQHHRWMAVQEVVLQEVEQEIGSAEALKLAMAYWFDPKVRERGAELEVVSLRERHGTAKPHAWVALCRKVQEQLQAIVRARELVIEINPSSNRFIGPMDSLSEHPVFALTLDEQQRLRRLFRVTVNTDNPGVFATSLAHEYYMLAEERLQAGMAEAEVVDWLAWLRHNSENYSFLRYTLPPEHPEIQRLLEELSERYRPLMRQMQGQRIALPQHIIKLHESERMRPLIHPELYDRFRHNPTQLRRLIRAALEEVNSR